jgi:hypothetical protein
MTAFHYIPDSYAMEVQDIITEMREDIAFHESKLPTMTDAEAKEKRQRRIGHLQKHIVTLEGVLRRLEITNDIKMNLIAEDIMEKIMAVRKDKMADKFVGIIVYYELQPRYKWREDGLNPVACVSNVKGWPYGENTGMTDLGNGTFAAEHEQAGPGCWVLGGQYIPIDVEKGGDQ